jgi:hypothetical protein
MVRNEIIAQHFLIVCPGEHVEQRRSGTWATYRRRKKGCIIIWPDGTTQELQ